VTTALRDDARRLSALGGRLRVERPSRHGATVVDIRLPERLRVDWPELDRPDGDRSAPPAPEQARPAAGPAAQLLDTLVTEGGPGADHPAVRVALDRRDGRPRVVVLGAGAAELLRTLRGAGARDAPAGTLPPLCYEYRQHPALVLEPAGGAPPWRPVRLADLTRAAWPGAAAGVARVVIGEPVPALRGLLVVHRRERVDAELAVRLRGWAGTAEGPPDAVVLVLSGPVSTAESEFLTALRTPGRDGYPPVVICASGPGTHTSTQRLLSMCDAVVDRPSVEAELDARVRDWAEVVSARWSLRALVTCAAGVPVGGEWAGAVEAAVTGAYQEAELDLLQALQARRIRLPRGEGDALRLLGAYGRDPGTRLGLAAGAGPAEVAGAAVRALSFWRAQSQTPDSPRQACAVLIRAGERLHAGAGT
jgi:hypothetical protein